jgi:hypothetical protein
VRPARIQVEGAVVLGLGAAGAGAGVDELVDELLDEELLLSVDEVLDVVEPVEELSVDDVDEVVPDVLDAEPPRLSVL